MRTRALAVALVATALVAARAAALAPAARGDPAPPQAAQVFSGIYHSLGIKSDGSLWAWGHDSYGQLGIGTASQANTPLRVGADADWLTPACGGDHTLALKTDGSLWGWGCNDDGQLGLGDQAQRDVPARVGSQTGWFQVSAGEAHSAAVRTDGTLWAWGDNQYGQLGLGDTTQRMSPVQIGTSTQWRAVLAGRYHSGARQADGSLWTWGCNGSGQLGLGDTSTRKQPVQVGSGATWVAVVAGNSHCVGVQNDGAVWTWGDPDFGQLGLGDLMNRLRPAFAFYLDDLTAPLTAASGADDAYHAAPVSVAFAAGDGAGSGVARTQVSTDGGVSWARVTSVTIAAPADHSGDGLHPITYRSIDKAGNVEGARSVTVRIDTTPPSMTHDYDGSWRRGGVTVTFSAGDALSGVAHTFVTLPDGAMLADQPAVVLRTWKRGGNSGEHTLTYYAVDAAGNVPAAPKTVVVRLDSRAPSTKDDAPDGPRANAVTVHLTARDAHSGVAKTLYALDGGEWTEGTSVTVAAPLNGSNDGVHWIAYRSVDVAGNVELTRWCSVTIAVSGRLVFRIPRVRASP